MAIVTTYMYAAKEVFKIIGTRLEKRVFWRNFACIKCVRVVPPNFILSTKFEPKYLYMHLTHSYSCEYSMQ